MALQDEECTMIRPKSSPPLLSVTQFIAIVALTVVLLTIVDLGRRATAGYYVAQAEKRLQAEVQVELTRNAELKARRDYVMSDEYVEKWAREHAHMIRPGDRPVILVTPQSPTARSSGPHSAGITVTPTPVPNWYLWWRLFFDAPFPPTARDSTE